ncbi:MAG: hypothetical protein IT436_05255 [Phycisphaerales bacterium]|nr:hypothetical protein [Phycisphaerales bacterium]
MMVASKFRLFGSVIAVAMLAAVCVGANIAAADDSPPPPRRARLSDFNPGQIDRVHRVIYLKPGEVPSGPAPILWTYRRLLMSPHTIELGTPG